MPLLSCSPLRFFSRLLLLLLAFGVAPAAYAQYQLKGVTLDRETRQPLPFVSIAVKGTTLGTSSNAEGEFVLNLPRLPQTLVFSEITHVRDTVQVTSASKPLELLLAEATVSLPEVRVGSYAFQLVDRAYLHLQRNYGQKFYGKAFYRQVTRIDNEPTEIQEMVWNVKSNNARIEGTRPAQGRYAARQALMNFKNFSFYTKAYGLYDPLADSTASLAVLSPNTVQNYLLELVGVVERGATGGVAEITFETRPEISYRARGTIWIDTETYKVERFKITTPVFTLNANNPAFTFRDKQFQVDMLFRNSSGAAAPLEYIKTDMSFALDRPQQKGTRVSAAAFTFFYDTKEKPTGITYAPVTRDERDMDEIKSLSYDPEFWADNPVVKRTPVEDEVISSFEQKGAFGTMVKPTVKKQK